VKTQRKIENHEKAFFNKIESKSEQQAKSKTQSKAKS
jgi:hypothetical protein